MSEMIERVSKALLAAQEEIQRRLLAKEQITDEQILAIQARAAIEAMREPTAGMYEGAQAGWAISSMRPPGHAENSTFRQIWRAMVDEALK